MKSILVLGVTRISDSYPNVKYKIAALAGIFGERYVDAVIAVDEKQEFAAIVPGQKPGRLRLVWKLSWGHLRAFYRSITHRSDAVYVCYPGIAIAAWLGLPFIRSRYEQIYLDAFISLYDTVVVDRGLLEPGQIVARLLFALERRALKVATTVIVDTPENAAYYSELFAVPLAKFKVLPLSIPPLSPSKGDRRDSSESRLRCVFVGTFVPLQGVPVIVEAAKLLAGEPDIEFVFVGDGQDASCLETFMDSSAARNVTWHRGHFPTDFVVQQIQDADLCLGVFGEGEKTQRVLPYKLYYYLALSAPVITASSATAERILAECAALGEPQPLSVVPAGDAQALANALRHCRDNRAGLARLRPAAGQYYQRALSAPVIQRQLTELLHVVIPADDNESLTPERDDIVQPDTANIAAVIVAYFPDKHFQQRMDALSGQFTAVFCVDNTPQANDREQPRCASNVRYSYSGENIGLASALNLACRAAIDAGFQWVVTFDQDSLPADDFVTRTIDCWQRSPARTFMLGCNYTDSIDNEFPRFPSGTYVRECRTVITSGSLMCLSPWDNLGGFRDDYFIDGVDHEICLRARKHALMIARHGEVLMQHQIGEKSPGFRFLPYVQPAVRLYYGTRNSVRNIIAFAPSEPIWAARRGFAVTWESLVAVLLGPGRVARLGAVLRGVADGVRGRMGPIPGDYSAR